MNGLNFGHCKSKISDFGAVEVHHRVWHLDPYLSNAHIEEILAVLPSAKRLEGKPTGVRYETNVARMNLHGTQDEPPAFLKRWCVIL